MSSDTLPRKFLHGRGGLETIRKRLWTPFFRVWTPFSDRFLDARRCGPAASAGRAQTFREAYKMGRVTAKRVAPKLIPLKEPQPVAAWEISSPPFLAGDGDQLS